MKKLIKVIQAFQIPYELKDEEIAGVPDISFRSRRLAVFIRKKIDQQRDNRIRRKLQRRGWQTTVIWDNETLDTQRQRIAKRLGLTTI